MIDPFRIPAPRNAAESTRRVATGLACWPIVGLLLLLAVQCADAQSATNRLADIRSRGTLNCGTWPQVPGFAIRQGEAYAGFEIDICRAVAAAIFGDATKVSFVALAHVADFRQRNDVDLVARRLTWTPGREAATGMVFGPVTFYDGQGFLVPKSRGITSVSQLHADRICVIDMERHPQVLSDYLKDSGRTNEVVLVKSDKAAEEALLGKRCAAYSADVSWLAAARAGFADGLTKYEILPDVISKEPLAPLMRRGDVELVQLVQWTIFALIEAEELGVNSHNVGDPRPSSMRVRRFMSVHPGSVVALGAGDWVRAIIAAVGNYGEVFDRNLGAGSSIKLERGLNRLWIDGGLIYSPPLH